MKVEFSHRYPKSRYPQHWDTKVRPVLAKNLAKIEERIGSPLVAENRSPLRVRVASPLGAPGSYGVVYQIEKFPDRVLKITTDALEGPYSFYVSQLQSLGVETASGPVAHASVIVFDVFRIEAEIPIWGIVIERVFCITYDPVRKSVIPASVPMFVLNGADRYNDGWNALRGHSVPLFDLDTGKRISKSRKISAAAARDLVSTGLDVLDRSPLTASLSDFLRLVWKDDHPLTDIHRNNIGLRRGAVEGYPGTTQGQIVAFDFGCSPVSSAVRRSAVKNECSA